MDNDLIQTAIQLKDYGKVRELNDAVSVFDLVGVIGGKKNPHDAFGRLCKQYLEVLALPGPGQRKTPFVSRQDALYIIGLLPGIVGRTYREDAAKLYLAFIETPEKLAHIVIDRIDDPKAALNVADAAVSRAEYLLAYHPLMAFVQELEGTNSFTFMNLNKLNTKTVCGKTPEELRLEFGVTNTRSVLTPAQIRYLATLQDIQLMVLQSQGVKTSKEAYGACKQMATSFGLMIRPQQKPAK